MSKRQDQSTYINAGLNLIGQALSIFDSDLRLVLANRPMKQMFDLPATLVQPGAGFDAIIRHLAQSGEYGEIADLDGFVQSRVDLARVFEPHYMERTRANGRTISVEGAPLAQGGWVTVYTDITDTKAQQALLRARSETLSEEVLERSEALSATNRALAAANAALVEARQALAETEARTRTTTQMMPAHIARVDAGGIYTFSNRALPSVMPGRPAEVLGTHIGETLGTEAFAKVRPHLESAQNGRASTFEFTDEASGRRIRAAFTPDPHEPGVYILSQDVTQETQARAALQQTKRREMAAQLTSGLAHDFSNLLTIILGAQSKLSALPQTPETSALITATRQAAERGGALLARIADITGPRVWTPEPLTLQAFFEDFALLARASLPDGMALRIDDETDGAFLLDTGLMQDAALNLVLNARDASGGAGTITIAARTLQDTWLELAVSDTGPGFSDTALRHALDAFFTTKGGEGSGLGLPMVYDMAKLAGGTLRIANRPSGGARVALRLPLRRAEGLPRTGLVLLVEDSPDLRASVRDMLTVIGYQVVEAASVDEAVLVASGLPDIALILSDISLEGEAPGTDLHHRLPDLPLRLMTSLPPGHPDYAEARALGPVLPKPFDARALARFLEGR